MIKLYAALGLVLVAGVASAYSSFQTVKGYDRWLSERYEEATSVKAGMTRADLKRVFCEDGGLQSIPARRYVLKSSGMIKVDVEFEFPAGADGRTAPDESVRLKSVSKPYLERAYTD